MNRLPDLFCALHVISQMLGGYRPFFVASACTTKKVTFPPQSWATISPEAVDLCRGLLEQDPALRTTALQAREHPWITNSLVPMPPSMLRNPSHLTLQNLAAAGSVNA
jgi:serine/threonine protein kinase